MPTSATYSCPLAVGGTVCVPPETLWELDGETLAAWIEDSRIETLHCVPSLLSTLLFEPLDSRRFPALRRVLVAGEVLHVDVARRWLELFGNRIALVNLYGPSETTMVKFFHRVEERDLERGFVPIGKPMPGARGLVLGADGSPCPPGVMGELFIRTAYRTLGYHRRPELTAQAFIRNPFRDDPDDLLYRTGDLVRVLPDGNLQFLGRRDDQVKIRGLRVELSEIEGHLRSHPAVREAAAVQSAEDGREPRLIAFVVARDKGNVSYAELRKVLKSRLPAPMVPTHWAVLDALPRTPTGKTDREALGRMRPDSRAGETAFVTPRTPVETAVAEIWKELLGAERVGALDDFFELGGHSLLATQLVSRVAESFGLRLPLRRVFEEPTLEGLSLVITVSLAEAREDGEVLRILTEVRRPSDEEARSRRGAVQESLAAIWRDVLRVEEIGVHDDFFAVGGDSVLATQILARVEERFGVQVSLVTLFEAKTIAALASILEP